MAQRTATQLKNQFLGRDPQDHNDDLVDSFALGVFRRIGDVWFVDPVNGSDSNTGDTQDQAFATTQAAVDAATDGNGDYIVRLPGTESITQAVTLDKTGLTLVGTEYGQAPIDGSEQFLYWPDAAYTDGPAFIVEAICRFQNIGAATRNTSDAAANQAAGSSAAIAIDDGVNFCHITGCRFPAWVAQVAGVKAIGNSYGQIDNCKFEISGGSLTRGIWYTSGPTHNPTYNKVRWCEFIGAIGACVEYQVGTGSDGNLLQGNTTQGVTLFLDTNGETSSPVSVAIDNYLDFATLAASFDQANIAALEAIGWRYINNHIRDT